MNDNSEIPDNSQKGRKTAAAQHWLGAVIGMAILGILLWIASGIFRNMPSAGIALTIQLGRPLHDQLIGYYEIHGTFPPAELEGIIYSSLPDALSTNIIHPVLSRSGKWEPGYDGPPLDPFRQTRMFESDKMSVAQFRNMRYSHAPFHWYSGFPLRYFRSSDATLALIIGNGPDEDADIGAAEITSSDIMNEESMVIHLASLTYDATNGTTSDGDIYRITEAPAHANSNTNTSTSIRMMP